jgi:hypothetical protein
MGIAELFKIPGIGWDRTVTKLRLRPPSNELAAERRIFVTRRPQSGRKLSQLLKENLASIARTSALEDVWFFSPCHIDSTSFVTVMTDGDTGM